MLIFWVFGNLRDIGYIKNLGIGVGRHGDLVANINSGNSFLKKIAVANGLGIPTRIDYVSILLVKKN
jgi:hypothetical protein